MAKMSTFSGDETAPCFGFLSAAVALVFSCMGAACGTVKTGVGVASMGVMRPELVMKSIVPWAIVGHFNSIPFQSEKIGAYESCGQYALDWLQSVRNCYVGYDVPGISDHSKLINHGDVQLPSGPKPFRFFHVDKATRFSVDCFFRMEFALLRLTNVQTLSKAQGHKISTPPVEYLYFWGCAIQCHSGEAKITSGAVGA